LTGWLAGLLFGDDDEEMLLLPDNFSSNVDVDGRKVKRKSIKYERKTKAIKG